MITTTNQPISEGLEKVLRGIIKKHLHNYKDINEFRKGMLKLADATHYKCKYHKIPVKDILLVMDKMSNEAEIKKAH